MTENMKKYLELISKDEEAQKKLNEQAAESIQEAKERIISDAAVKGISQNITLTEEDFAETADIGELSEDELDAVAGGKNATALSEEAASLPMKRRMSVAASLAASVGISRTGQT